MCMCMCVRICICVFLWFYDQPLFDGLFFYFHRLDALNYNVNTNLWLQISYAFIASQLIHFFSLSIAKLPDNFCFRSILFSYYYYYSDLLLLFIFRHRYFSYTHTQTYPFPPALRFDGSKFHLYKIQEKKTPHTCTHKHKHHICVDFVMLVY